MSPIKGILILGGVVFVLAIFGANQPTIPKAEQEGWRKGGVSRSEFHTLMFVEVDQAHMQNRVTYDRAVKWLCHTSTVLPTCRIMFYAPGDPFPPANIQTVGLNIPAGYTRTLAMYSAERDGSPGDFHKWDCERAGTVGAPVTALCGAVGMNHAAVISLSLRASRSVGCGWPRYDADAEGVRRFIQQTTNFEERALYQKAYDLFYGSGSSRPDDPANCTRLRSQIEAEASDARKILGVPPPPAQTRVRSR